MRWNRPQDPTKNQRNKPEPSINKSIEITANDSKSNKEVQANISSLALNHAAFTLKEKKEEREKEQSLLQDS